MYENIPLVILTLIWLVIAIIQDLRKREIENWLNFSLIVFALAYRAFYSVFSSNVLFFLYGLLGFLIFFILANLFYYSRLFAGGDAKLFMALGTILPTTSSFSSNIYSFLAFIFLVLICGSIYSLIYSSVLGFTNRDKFAKEFALQLNKNKKLFIVSALASAFVFIISMFSGIYFINLLIIIFLLFPILYIYAKAVENSCMIINIETRKLTIGDWLAEKVKVKNNIIKPNWEGLDEEEIKLIQKFKKKVKIKQGIPFSPSFLFAFLILILLKNSLTKFV